MQKKFKQACCRKQQFASPTRGKHKKENQIQSDNLSDLNIQETKQVILINKEMHLKPPKNNINILQNYQWFMSLTFSLEIIQNIARTKEATFRGPCSISEYMILASKLAALFVLTCHRYQIRTNFIPSHGALSTSADWTRHLHKLLYVHLRMEVSSVSMPQGHRGQNLEEQLKHQHSHWNALQSC